MLHCTLIKTLELVKVSYSSQIANYNRNLKTACCIIFSVSLNLLCNIIFLDIQIIQPPVDLFIVTFNESSNSVQLTCSLNIDILSSVTVRWFLNSLFTPPHEAITTDNTTTLLIENPQPSDAGDYTCFFMGLNVQRIIVLG